MEILSLPADPYLTTLAGQNLTLASPQGSDTSDYKLVSSAATQKCPLKYDQGWLE